MKKIIALILAVVSIFSVMSISVYAEEAEENTVVVTVDDTDFIFNKNTSEEFRNRFIMHHINPDNYGVESYGLMCTLFGHKLESQVVTTVKHKAKATDPRCLQERYNSEACTRCDYTNSTLISSVYISCC